MNQNAHSEVPPTLAKKDKSPTPMKDKQPTPVKGSPARSRPPVKSQHQRFQNNVMEPIAQASILEDEEDRSTHQGKRNNKIAKDKDQNSAEQAKRDQSVTPRSRIE